VGEGDTRRMGGWGGLGDTEGELRAQGDRAPLQPHTGSQGPHDTGPVGESPSAGGWELSLSWDSRHTLAGVCAPCLSCPPLSPNNQWLC